MSMNGKICAKCCIELRPKTNGICIAEMSCQGAEALWSADLWHCPQCGLEVILGTGSQPINMYWDPEFTEKYIQPDVIRTWADARQKEEHAEANP